MFVKTGGNASIQYKMPGTHSCLSSNWAKSSHRCCCYHNYYYYCQFPPENLSFWKFPFLQMNSPLLLWRCKFTVCFLKESNTYVELIISPRVCLWIITMILDGGESHIRFNITTYNLFLKFCYSEKHLQGRHEIVSSPVAMAEDELPVYSRKYSRELPYSIFPNNPTLSRAHCNRACFLTVSHVTANCSCFNIS